MLKDLETRIQCIGYALTEGDLPVLEYMTSKIEKEIIRDAGIYDSVSRTMVVPDHLHSAEVDIIAGEFLQMKKNTGTLTGFSFDAAVKDIKEGDVSVSYAIGSGQRTPEQRMEILINTLIGDGRAAILGSRKIKW